MKPKLLLGLLACAACAFNQPIQAADVQLAWDASVSPGPLTYKLYAHTNNIFQTPNTNALVQIEVGTNLTATAKNLNPGRWFFAATAKLDGQESDFSNVVQYEVPVEPPTGMRTVFIEHSLDLTSFKQVGFFRLRLP